MTRAHLIHVVRHHWPDTALTEINTRRMSMTPHRTEPLTATINVIIDGVPHSAAVVLSPVAREPKRLTALRVVQDAPREHAICPWCTHSPFASVRCPAQHGWQDEHNKDGTCKLYTPTLWTRIVRTLRLGRKAVTL